MKREGLPDPDIFYAVTQQEFSEIVMDSTDVIGLFVTEPDARAFAEKRAAELMDMLGANNRGHDNVEMVEGDYGFSVTLGNNVSRFDVLVQAVKLTEE